MNGMNGFYDSYTSSPKSGTMRWSMMLQRMHVTLAKLLHRKHINAKTCKYFYRATPYFQHKEGLPWKMLLSAMEPI